MISVAIEVLYMHISPLESSLDLCIVGCWLQVTGIYRYTADPVCFAQYDVKKDCVDIFDITLSDGSLKLKCCLHPDLNNEVTSARVWSVGE